MNFNYPHQVSEESMRREAIAFVTPYNLYEIGGGGALYSLNILRVIYYNAK